MNRREFVLGLLPAASVLALSAQCRAATGGGQDVADAIDVVDAFGFVPDGRTDNYEAFHRWAEHVNRARGGSYVFRPGTYYVHRFRKWPGVGPVRNPEIRGCDGLSVSGAGARILLNGKFHRSKRGGRDSAAFMPFVISDSRDVRISGFEIDGGIRGMTRDKDVTEAYSHLIALLGCNGVVLEDLDLHHSQTDGVYLSTIRVTGVRSRACRNISLRNLRCHNNARGGMAIIQAYGVTATDCEFRENGYNLGGYAAHPPHFGVTVEPDYFLPAEIDVLTGNLEFRRCRFLDNATAFSGVYRARVQGYLRLIDCTSSNRFGSVYHMTLNWPGAVIQGGRHDAGAGTIWTSWDKQTGGDVEFRDCEIRTAGRYGLFHAFAGNLLKLRNVRLIGTNRKAGEPGWLLAVQGDPGGGRRNLVEGCEIFVPAARKSRAHAYDYQVSFANTSSRNNLFRTDLPASGGQHFCTDYGRGTTARGDRYRGTAPGPGDSFRPVHNAAHDTRLPFSAG